MERQGRIELLVICLEGSGSTIELRTQKAFDFTPPE